MSKLKTTVTDWLNSVFGGDSLKQISESLTAEQYSQVVQGAENFLNSDGNQEGEGGEDPDGAEDPKNEDPGNTDPSDADLQAQVSALTSQLETANADLAAEKKTHGETSAKLTAAQTALSAALDNNKKLRSAVNPVSDEDLSNKNTEKQTGGLTKTDIAAREAFKNSHPQA